MIEIAICAGDRLHDGGTGVRFPLTGDDGDATGFVVRFQGQVHAYVNRCAHVPIELDWNEGEFFESSGLYIMCATHGAIYLPESGRCAGGPCRGGALRKIRVVERDGLVFWLSDDVVAPARA